MGLQPELQIEQRKLLDFHLELVLKENERSNLTRIVDWQQGQLLHIEDSLVGLQEMCIRDSFFSGLTIFIQGTFIDERDLKSLVQERHLTETRC